MQAAKANQTKANSYYGVVYAISPLLPRIWLPKSVVVLANRVVVLAKSVVVLAKSVVVLVKSVVGSVISKKV